MANGLASWSWPRGGKIGRLEISTSEEEACRWSYENRLIVYGSWCPTPMAEAAALNKQVDRMTHPVNAT